MLQIPSPGLSIYIDFYFLNRNNSVGIDLYLDFNISFLFSNWIFKKTKETGLVSNTKSSVCLFFTSMSLFSNHLEESIDMVLTQMYSNPVPAFIWFQQEKHILF
jgi:hypothetical protein